MSEKNSPSDYSLLAPVYDLLFDRPLSEGHKTIAELISTEALQYPKLKVLEVGVGSGLILNRLPAGVDYTGIDVNDKMLDLAREKSKRLKLEDRVHLSNMDAEDLSFTDESFDLVIAPSVLSAMGSPEKAFGEMIRVTKASGKIAVVVNLRDDGLRSRIVRHFDQLTRRFVGFRLDLTREKFVHDSLRILDDHAVNQLFGFPLSSYLLFEKK